MPYIGNPAVVGDSTNTFKLLDDIQSFTLTFDATDTSVVSISADTLTFRNHRFLTGQRVTYNDGGGTAIGGLADGVYFIIKVDQNTIKLASSASNAASSTAINLTSGAAGGSHTLNVAFDSINTKFSATHSSGTKAGVSRAGQISLSINGVIQQPQDTGSPTVGYGVLPGSIIIFSTAPAATDKVFGTFIGEVAASFDLTDNTVDNFTGDGSTTSFNLSRDVPSSNDVLVTLDGVTQYPTDSSATRSYAVIESTLTFVSAPDTGVAIQVRHIGFAGATTSAVTGFYGRQGNVALVNTDDISVQNISAGIGTFNTIAVGGTVSIGGTLTYEDVTNIDSVGLVTARNGIVVGSGITLSKDGDGFFTGIVTATSFSGSGANLTSLPAAQLSGTAAAINGSNITNLNASAIASGTVPTARLGSGTASSSTFLAGDSTYKTVTGTTINNNANNRIITGSGTANTLEGESGLTYDGSTLQVNGDGQFTGNDGTANQLKWDKSDDSLYFRDGVKAQFGTGGDLKIFHDGSDSYVSQTGTGNLILQGNASNNIAIRAKSGEEGINLIPDGAVQLYHDNRLRAYTVGNGFYVEQAELNDDVDILLNNKSTSIGNNQKSALTCRVAKDAGGSHGGTNRSAVFGHNFNSTTGGGGFFTIRANDGTGRDFYMDNNTNLRVNYGHSNIGTTNGTVVGSQSSDIRNKNLVGDGSVSYGLSEILQLNPIKYQYKKELVNRIGFSAQQVESIIPESVYDTGQDQDNEGNVVSGDTIKAMYYVDLIPVLVNAIKELKTENDALKARVTTLEGS